VLLCLEPLCRVQGGRPLVGDFGLPHSKEAGACARRGCYTNYGIGACVIAGISVEYGDAEHAFLDFTGLPTQRVLYNIG
jgi:hypothetical protein